MSIPFTRRKLTLKPNDEESKLAVAILVLEDFAVRYRKKEPNGEPIQAKFPDLSDSSWIKFEQHARSLGLELKNQKVDVPKDDGSKRGRMISRVLVRELVDNTAKLT